MDDKLVIGGKEFSSRFILGSGKYSMKLIEAAVKDAGAQIITLAVRRTNTKDQENILDYIPEGVTLLPNTSGARNAQEAIRIARLARELGCGNFVKIEIMRDSKYLLPDNQETIKATEVLAKEGFVVMPYMYPDLNAARDMVNAGAATIMPLASPIGSNKGLATKEFIRWKWERLRSWLIQLLQQQEICLLWHLPLRMLYAQGVRHILQDSGEYLQEVRLHPIRLPDFLEIKKRFF